MKKHFATAFIAASTLLVLHSHHALARSTHRHAEPLARHGHLPAPTETAAETGAQTSAWAGETGKASYYGPSYHGHLSADGSRFDQMAMTAAHPWLPFGTKVRVLLAGSSRSVIVTITDRLATTRRIVDLSLAAARELGMVSRGIAEVTLVPI